MDADPREYEGVRIDEGDVKNVLLGYLVHNCFKETAEAFVSSTGMKLPSDCGVDIDRRRPIYNSVMEGKSMDAIELTNHIAPGMLEVNKDLHFDLLSIHYIELVRRKDSEGALEFAQKQLTPFDREKRFVEKLQDCMALLAYEEPEKSPMFHLLNAEYREGVADTLNRALLDHSDLPSYTAMERLIQQATLVLQRLQQERGKDGPAFSLQSFLKG